MTATAGVLCSNWRRAAHVHFPDGAAQRESAGPLARGQATVGVLQTDVDVADRYLQEASRQQQAAAGNGRGARCGLVGEAVHIMARGRRGGEPPVGQYTKWYNIPSDCGRCRGPAVHSAWTAGAAGAVLRPGAAAAVWRTPQPGAALSHAGRCRRWHRLPGRVAAGRCSR